MNQHRNKLTLQYTRRENPLAWLRKHHYRELGFRETGRMKAMHCSGKPVRLRREFGPLFHLHLVPLPRRRDLRRCGLGN